MFTSSVLSASLLATAANAIVLRNSCAADTCYNAFLGSGDDSASSFCNSALGTSTATYYATSTSVELETITNYITQTDEIDVIQTIESTEVDQITLTSEVDVFQTVTYIATTAEETVTVLQKRDGPKAPLKKRKVCPPKSLTSSTPISNSTVTSSALTSTLFLNSTTTSSAFMSTLTSESTTSDSISMTTPVPESTTSSALANPTSICTDSSQISSACSCLGFTQSTVTQTSTIGLTLTQMSSIEETITQTETLTSFDSEYTTLISTDVIYDTQISVESDPATAIATVTDLVPRPTSTSFILQVIASYQGAQNGMYVGNMQYNSFDTYDQVLPLVQDSTSAIQFSIANGKLMLAATPEKVAYTGSGGTGEVIFTMDVYAVNVHYSNATFYIDRFPPYYPGNTGTLSSSTTGLTSFVYCPHTAIYSSNVGTVHLSNGEYCSGASVPSYLQLEYFFV